MSRFKFTYFLLICLFSSNLLAFKGDEEVTPEERERLKLAVERNNMPEVCNLITASGLNPNTRDGTHENRTPMHHAVSPEMVLMLWSLGAELDSADSFGMTPLHVAAFAFENDIVQMLLRLGANHLVEDQDGDLPWHLTTVFCPQSIREQLAIETNDEDSEDSNNNGSSLSEEDIDDEFVNNALPATTNRITLWNF